MLGDFDPPGTHRDDALCSGRKGKCHRNGDIYRQADIHGGLTVSAERFCECHGRIKRVGSDLSASPYLAQAGLKRVETVSADKDAASFSQHDF